MAEGHEECMGRGVPSPVGHILRKEKLEELSINWQGLKWGRVAGVGDPAPFDLPGL